MYTYGRRHGLSLAEPTPPITGAHVIYLPLVAQNYDPERIQQPFAVVATSAGFQAGYDFNGNMLARVEIEGTERVTYTQGWDVENRLSVVTNTVTGEVTRFVCDGDGQRVLREDGSGVTVYLGPVEVHVTGTQRVTRTYYHAGGQRIAMREGEELTYLHGDHLGSASLTTNSGGGIVAEQRYMPYGQERWSSSALPTDYQYTGQRRESGLGLYDYAHRRCVPGSTTLILAASSLPIRLSRTRGIRRTLTGMLTPEIIRSSIRTPVVTQQMCMETAQGLYLYHQGQRSIRKR